MNKFDIKFQKGTSVKWKKNIKIQTIPNTVVQTPGTEKATAIQGDIHIIHIMRAEADTTARDIHPPVTLIIPPGITIIITMRTKARKWRGTVTILYTAMYGKERFLQCLNGHCSVLS